MRKFISIRNIIFITSILIIGYGLIYYCNLHKPTFFAGKQDMYDLGQIIFGETRGAHRRFIQISNDGYYIIQDFKSSGMPITNPYRVKALSDLTKNYSEQTSIDGLYVAIENDIYGGRKYINYVNGMKEGRAFALHTNGAMKRIEKYHHDSLRHFVHYFRNGEKNMEGTISNDKIKSTLTVWWYKGGKKYEAEKNGKKSIEITWFENGIKKAEIVDNNKNKYGTSWHENGGIASEISIENDIPVKCSEWHKTGENIIKDEIKVEICNDVRSRYYNFRYVFEADINDLPPLGDGRSEQYSTPEALIAACPHMPEGAICFDPKNYTVTAEIIKVEPANTVTR